MMYNLKVQAKAGNPALLDAYKALSTTQEKDQFLMNWQLDKKKAALRAQETITRGKAHGSTKEDNWWTEHQLATRGGFGEAVAAMMVKDLPKLGNCRQLGVLCGGEELAKHFCEPTGSNQCSQR